VKRDGPHPRSLRSRSLSREGRGEIECAASASPSPSTLAGEGGGARSAAPGEGSVPALRPRELRKTMTDAERKLWHALRDRRFANIKFRRQVPLGNYIVDFVSFEKRIIVEADGSQHVESRYDAARDRWLKAQGFAVLRFWNTDILNGLEGVLDAIAEEVKRRPSPARFARSPLPRGSRADASYWIDDAREGKR
jgi:very-short-patch-repair endonuclease